VLPNMTCTSLCNSSKFGRFLIDEAQLKKDPPSPATVACVIKSDRESMRVLDQNGSVRTILPSQVTNKIEARRTAVATDRNGSEIRVGDSIRETSGELRTGTILHIHRSFLFCNNRTQIENSGELGPRHPLIGTV
jgi:transcription elongation factor SPT5